MKNTILQIIPAPGWHAKYKQDDGSIELSPVICFALVEQVESDGVTVRYVAAMDADGSGLVEFSSEAVNFAGLAHEADPDYAVLRATPGPRI